MKLGWQQVHRSVHLMFRSHAEGLILKNLLCQHLNAESSFYLFIFRVCHTSVRHRKTSVALCMQTLT